MKRDPAIPLLARARADARVTARAGSSSQGRSAAAAPTAADLGRAWRALAAAAASHASAPSMVTPANAKADIAPTADARLRAVARATAQRIASGPRKQTQTQTQPVPRPADAPAVSPLLPPLPRFLQVEPVGRCNLACRMCAVPQRPAEQQAGLLSVEDFERLLSQLPQLEEVHLQGLGEPMLHPAFFTLVERAARRGIRVSANTNATLITPARARACVTSGLAALSFSVDGARAETYASIRVDGSFAKVVRNIERVVRARRELRSATPSLRLVMVLMRQNLDELPALVELATRLGVPEVLVQRLASEMNEPTLPARYIPVRRYVADSELRGFDLAEAAAVFAAARERAARVGVLLHLPKLPVRPTALRSAQLLTARPQLPIEAHGIDNDRASIGNAQPVTLSLPRARGRVGVGAAADTTPTASTSMRAHSTVLPAASSSCDWPFAKGYVTATGEMLPCCMVGTPDRATLGNALADGVAAVWRGATAQQWRAGLLGTEPGALCAQCALFRGAF